jgi:hypothetical protein
MALMLIIQTGMLCAADTYELITKEYYIEKGRLDVVFSYKSDLRLNDKKYLKLRAEGNSRSTIFKRIRMDVFQIPIGLEVLGKLGKTVSPEKRPQNGGAPDRAGESDVDRIGQIFMRVPTGCEFTFDLNKFGKLEEAFTPGYYTLLFKAESGEVSIKKKIEVKKFHPHEKPLDVSFRYRPDRPIENYFVDDDNMTKIKGLTGVGYVETKNNDEEWYLYIDLKKERLIFDKTDTIYEREYIRIHEKMGIDSQYHVKTGSFALNAEYAYSSSGYNVTHRSAVTRPEIFGLGFDASVGWGGNSAGNNAIHDLTSSGWGTLVFGDANYQAPLLPHRAKAVWVVISTASNAGYQVGGKSNILFGDRHVSGWSHKDFTSRDIKFGERIDTSQASREFWMGYSDNRGGDRD